MHVCNNKNMTVHIKYTQTDRQRLPLPNGGLVEAANARCTSSTIAFAAFITLMLLPLAARAPPPPPVRWLRATLLLTSAPQSWPAAADVPSAGMGVIGAGGSVATAAAMFVQRSCSAALKA